jgi:hypothetical protein
MKKTSFQIAVLALLLIMGCSKDELINDASENNQLKQGFWQGMNFESISKNDENFYTTTPVIYTVQNTQKLMLKNGSFFGSIQGKGKINQSSSYYTIDDLTQIPYKNFPLNSPQEFCYQMTASGKICITEKDYCLVDITGLIFIPQYRPSNYYQNHPNEVYYAFTLGDGIITMHHGAGKLKDINRTLKVFQGGNAYDTDLSIGQIRLKYFEH